MEVQQDFKELLELLNANRVEYVLVGAHALAYHGAPRYTGDLDLYVRPTPENAGRILEALSGFGFGSLGLSRDDFVQPDQVIQLGQPPVRVDLVTSISGVSWEEVSEHAIEDRFGNITVRYIGRNELLKNKRAIGRKKDLADLEALGEE